MKAIQTYGPSFSASPKNLSISGSMKSMVGGHQVWTNPSRIPVYLLWDTLCKWMFGSGMDRVHMAFKMIIHKT